MECEARITAHGTVRPCINSPVAGTRYCVIHADRGLVHAEQIARNAEITSRIALRRKGSKLPAATYRPRTAVHTSLEPIVDYIDSVRYYGRVAHDTATGMIDTYSANLNRGILDGSINGFEIGAIERDLDRLVARSRGKLMSSAQRLREREHKLRASGENPEDMWIAGKRTYPNGKSYQSRGDASQRVSIANMRRVLARV